MIALMTCFYAAFMLQEPPSTLDESTQEWTRKTSGKNIVSIEIVSRRYEAEGKPTLWLVGVAHIADAAFYEEVNSLLDEMDIVLFESVRPTGSRPPGGNTDEERIESTTLSMEFVADVAKRSAEETGDIPEQIEDVIANASLIDARLASFVEDASVGAWGRPYSIQVSPEKDPIALKTYVVREGETLEEIATRELGSYRMWREIASLNNITDPSRVIPGRMLRMPSRVVLSRITLWCFGSDGKLGGEGAAADIIVKREILISQEPNTQDKDKGIQAGMADALGLEFQLDALSYENPNWFCSDLTIGEVEAKLQERGADSKILKAITGEAFTAKIASGMMKLIPMLDMLAGGGVRETARLLMIEILTMPDVEKLMDGIEPELANVIIVDRNTEVLGDIAATLEVVEDISIIGVLYGAGHMKDLSERLHELFGYVPVEDRWIVAMSVDPNESFLDESDMKRMQFMLRFQLHKAEQDKQKKGDQEEQP